MRMPQPRVDAFDGVRAIAIALVMVFHARWPMPFVKSGGAAGVDIFFVLSGYLITNILLKSRPIGFKQLRIFYWRRFLRLFPALLTATVVLFVPGLFIYSDRVQSFIQNSLATISMTYVVWTGVFGMQVVGYGHMWSLSVEECFYVFFPIALIFSFRLRIKTSALSIVFAIFGFLAIGATAVECFLAPNSDGPQGLWGYLRVGGIALGCSLALLLSKSSRHQRIASGYLGIVGLALGLAISSNQQFLGLSFVLADVSTVFLIHAIVTRSNSWLTRVLSNGLLVYVGRISYELYVWHLILLDMAVTLTGVTADLTAVWVYPIAFVAAATSHKLWSPVQARFRTAID